MKNDEISIRTVDDDAEWDAFVAVSPHGTVFATSAWLVAVADIMGGRAIRLGAWHEGVLAVGVSFIEISRGSLRKAVSPVLSPYGGMLYAGDADGDGPADTPSRFLVLAERLIERIERRYHQSTLSHSPAFFDVRPFTWQGWDATVRYTYRIDITDPDAALGRFRKRVRHLINRAARTYTLESTVDAATVGAMFERTFRRQNMPPPITAGQVAALVERLGEAGLVDSMVAVDDGGDVAGVLVNALGDDTVYEMVNGTTGDNRHTGVYSFLNREAVTRYATTHHTLDLVGANIPSIAFFKRGFGGALTPYYVTERYSSGTARLALTTYTRLRRLIHT